MELVPLLDHGYIKVIETWGSDERIVESARMSTGKGFLGWGPYCSKCGIHMVNTLDGSSPAEYAHGEQKGCEHDADKPGDEKLLAYLWNHKHATPFEMAGMIVEVQAPIFVFREWHRHRTQSYNELSARYTPLPDMSYLPDVDRVLLNAGGSNKQAGTIAAADALTHEKALFWLERVQHFYRSAEELYQWGLKAGIPKELARVVVPVGRYSRMRASANLRNWLAFLTLRMDQGAQWEIRQYANTLGTFIKEAYPRTWELFVGDAR